MTGADLQSVVALTGQLGQLAGSAYLSGSAGPTDISLAVVPGKLPATPFVGYIDAEAVLVTGFIGTAVLSVVRGAAGPDGAATSPAPHAAGALLRVPDPAFLAFVAGQWPLYANQRSIDAILGGAYVEIDSIRYLMGQYALRRDWTGANSSSQKDSQIVDNYAALLKAAEARRDTQLAILRASRGAAVGQLTRQFPIERADPVRLPIEPSDRSYRGDPLRRS